MVGGAPIILDTDIGPDCDDAGALAVLHELANRGEAQIAGVMHCTSSPWGVGCIAAINSYYGRPAIPIGTLCEEGFLRDAQYETYNRFIASNYPHRFRNEVGVYDPQWGDGSPKKGASDGLVPPDATALYRELLAGAADRSMVVAAIGPLINLQRLLVSGPDEASPLKGWELVRRKVRKLVSMGGMFPAGEEWNFKLHPPSAAYIANYWPTPVLFCGFEAGADVMTGARLFIDAPNDHPVRKAYELYVKDERSRSSWDPLTVLCAVRGTSAVGMERKGRIIVHADGSNSWDDAGAFAQNHSYVKVMEDIRAIELVLDALMCGQASAD